MSLLPSGLVRSFSVDYQDSVAMYALLLGDTEDWGLTNVQESKSRLWTDVQLHPGNAEVIKGWLSALQRKEPAGPSHWDQRALRVY